LRLPVVAVVQYAVPLILAALTFWVAWRAVNVPPFADFLIATEAEMNKVSWSTRKRLTQDTIVVLITVLLMTLFLFVTDYFWGTLLSWRYIGVLPSSTQTQRDTSDPLQGKDIDW
jgi:preprotein translocase SecE subunit